MVLASKFAQTQVLGCLSAFRAQPSEWLYLKRKKIRGNFDGLWASQSPSVKSRRWQTVLREPHGGHCSRWVEGWLAAVCSVDCGHYFSAAFRLAICGPLGRANESSNRRWRSNRPMFFQQLLEKRLADGVFLLARRVTAICATPASLVLGRNMEGADVYKSILLTIPSSNMKSVHHHHFLRGWFCPF